MTMSNNGSAAAPEHAPFSGPRPLRHGKTAVLLITLAALLVGAPRASSAQSTPELTEYNDTGPRENETVATLLPLGATLLGWGMIIAAPSDKLSVAGVAGILLGPSLGHLYTGDYGHVVLQTLAITAGSGLIVAGALDDLCVASCSEQDSSSGTGQIILGLAIVTSTTVYSLYDAHRSAERRRIRRQRRLSLMPAPITGPDGSVGAGLVLGFSM